MTHRMNSCWLQARCAVLDFLYRGNVPGYASLPWHTRCKLNIHALAWFLRSAEFLHLATCLLIWMLAAQILIWTHDLRGPAAAAPGMLAAVWGWPWLGSARRRRIDALLQHRWPGRAL